MEWWVWLITGVGLLVLEMLTPGGFYFIFFGAGAIITAASAGLRWTPTILSQGLVFLIFSGISLSAFRRPMLDWMQRGMPKHKVDLIAGETAFPLRDIAAGDTGQAELRGTPWSAKNTGSRTLRAGERCRVERVEGLTIYLHPEA